MTLLCVSDNTMGAMTKSETSPLLIDNQVNNNTSSISSESKHADNKSTQDQKTFRQVVAAHIAFVYGIAGLCISAASVQVLAGSVPEFELNTWRFAAQFVVSAPVVLVKQKCNITVPRSKWIYLLLSVVLGNVLDSEMAIS